MNKVVILQIALAVFGVLLDYVLVVRPILQTLSLWLVGVVDALVSVAVVTPPSYYIAKRLNHK